MCEPEVYWKTIDFTFTLKTTGKYYYSGFIEKISQISDIRTKGTI